MTKPKTANKNSNLSPSKVFDVSMPGSVVPSKSARPIIANHQILQNDPMFAEASKTGEFGSYLNDISTRKDIEPISTNNAVNEKKDTIAKDSNLQQEIIKKTVEPENKVQTANNVPEALTQEQNNNKVSEENDIVPEKQNISSAVKKDLVQDEGLEDVSDSSGLVDAKNAKNIEDAEEKKRLEEAAELIISKEYFVKISQPKSHRITKTLVGLILIILAVAVVAYIIYSQAI